jgi:hypothetical protein
MSVTTLENDIDIDNTSDNTKVEAVNELIRIKRRTNTKTTTIIILIMTTWEEFLHVFNCHNSSLDKVGAAP